MSPRRIEVSHDEADSAAEALQRDAEFRALSNQSALERAARDARERTMAATLGRVPARLRLRGLVTYDHDDRVHQTFACGCDKPEHGHNPFASIKAPTELVFIDPAEEAAKLAERVNRARTQTPPVAAPPPGGRSGGRTPTAGRRIRR